MTSIPNLIFIAVIAGIAVALQGQFMGVIDRRAGTVTSVFLTYGIGGALALAWWLARRAPLENVRQIPWYAWSAGALGLIIVGGIGYTAPRLGLSRTMVITVAAQLAAAAIIEHFGLFASAERHFDIMRAGGFALMIGGVWMILE